MLVTPNVRPSATLVSMAAVTTAPGNRRTIQSKMSNGANGRPASFHPANETAVSVTVRRMPAIAPPAVCRQGRTSRGRRSFGYRAGDRGRVGVMGSPACAKCRHVGVHDGRQVQCNQLRDNQAADDGEAKRTARLASGAEPE